MRPPLILVAAAICLGVLLVSGCGSDEPTVTPEAAAWADGYCSAVSSFSAAVAATTTSVSANETATPEQARAALAPVGSAASSFAVEVGELTPPATDGATDVKKATDELSTTVAKYVDRGAAAVDAWEAGERTQADALSTIGSELRATKQVIQQTTAEVRTLDIDLGAAMNDSATCQSLIETLESEPAS
jgi:outer membrane murein-binding lipoprotein Lpp